MWKQQGAPNAGQGGADSQQGLKEEQPVLGLSQLQPPAPPMFSALIIKVDWLGERGKVVL